VYVKIFQQIFDSSIANSAKIRRMFIDMLILSDQDGVVDMTHEAIARRIGVPLDEVVWAIGKLLEPDPADRSGKKNGARLEFIDPGRDWGWRIVNYGHYRGLRDEESRRAYRRQWMRDFRHRQRPQSATKRSVNFVNKKHHPTQPCATQHNSREQREQSVNTNGISTSEPRELACTGVNTGEHACTQAEAEANMYVPSIVSQRETGRDEFIKAKEWINSLFGRQRAWSDDELQLVTEILPIDKDDRALLSWAYTLPRDAEGWSLVDGVRANKPKSNLIGLLREFSSEIDKWRGVKGRGRSGGKKNNGADELLPAEWVSAIKELYGDAVPIPRLKSQIASSAREEIEAAVKAHS